MQRKDIIFILVSSFIVIIAWIGFSIYHNLASSTISETVNVQINPVTPSFNTQVINALQQRKTVNSNLNLNSTAQNTSTQSSQAQTASQSSSLTATESALPLP